jgi:hypothetical protein
MLKTTLLAICLLTSVTSCADTLTKQESKQESNLKYLAGNTYEYDGFVIYKEIGYPSKKALIKRVETYSDIYDGYIERSTEYTSKLSEVEGYFTDHLSENLEKGSVLSHITTANLSEGCYNFNGEICGGKPEYLYNLVGGEKVSIRYTSNSLIGTDVTYKFDTFFHYYQDEILNTVYGSLKSQKIQFETYGLNKENKVVNKTGYYWWNEEFGVVRHEYKESPVEDKTYEAIYMYKLSKIEK